MCIRDREQVFDFITMGVNQSFDAWRRYQRFILPGVALCDRAACERLDQRYWLADNPEEMLGTYAGPVLIVTGKQDQIVGYEDQQALLPHYPNATFVTLDNACLLYTSTYDSGTIRVFGQPMTPTSYALKRRIGIVPQNVAVFNELTVTENIDYFCSLYVPKKTDRAPLVEESIEFRCV